MQITGVDVLAETRVLVSTDCLALLAIGGGLHILAKCQMKTKTTYIVHVTTVRASENIETMSVVGSDDDEGIIILANLLEVLDSSLDGIIKLEKLTKSTVIVESVHLLVNRGSLCKDD